MSLTVEHRDLRPSHMPDWQKIVLVAFSGVLVFAIVLFMFLENGFAALFSLLWAVLLGGLAAYSVFRAIENDVTPFW